MPEPTSGSLFALDSCCPSGGKRVKFRAGLLLVD